MTLYRLTESQILWTDFVTFKRNNHSEEGSYANGFWPEWTSGMTALNSLEIVSGWIDVFEDPINFSELDDISP